MSKSISDFQREQLEAAGLSWGRQQFDSEDIFAQVLPPEPDDEPGVYTVALAVRGHAEWQACEIWLDEEDAAHVYGKGECLPPEGVSWPWT